MKYYENKINEILNNLEEIDFLINNRSKINTEKFINMLTKVCLFQLSDIDVENRIEDYSYISQFPVNTENYSVDWYYELYDYLLSNNDVYKEYLYKYVRSHVKRYMLQREMKKYLSLLNRDIGYIEECSNRFVFGITPSVEFTRECTNIIKEKGYSKRLGELTDKYC